jgi:putative ABC transport system substrate-binding protein
MWMGRSGMSKRVYAGFKEYVAKHAPEVVLEPVIELKDEAAALPVYKRFQAEKRGVVFLRSSGVKFLMKHPPQKPTFIGGCTNPAALGAMKDLNSPPANITGVTYYIPASRQIGTLKKAFPGVKSVALLVEAGHPSSGIDSKETRAACKENGILYHEYSCASTDDIVTAMKDVYDRKIDLVIIGNQALIFDNGELIAKNARRTPVASYAEKPIKDGFALCGLAADDNKLGKMMANSLIDVLLKGKKISDIPVQTDPNPRFTVNTRVMDKLGTTLPGNLLKYAKKIE